MIIRESAVTSSTMCDTKFSAVAHARPAALANCAMPGYIGAVLASFPEPGMEATFFQHAEQASLVKAEIVAKYMAGWSRVMLANRHVKKIAYVDLLAGPGTYEDGTKSTPLLVLESIVKTPALRGSVMTLFNDGSAANAEKLEAAIGALPGVSELRYPPAVTNYEVDEGMAVVFEQTRLVPTLSFIDPFGYKAVTRRLLASFLKDWGSECIFFFNYRRVNAALSNSKLQRPVEALFGEERTAQLRSAMKGMSVGDREDAVVKALDEAIKELGHDNGYYGHVLPFRFRQKRAMDRTRSRSRTSHHLVFVTKDKKGYEIMKEVMAKRSSSPPESVPSYEYNPLRELELGLEDPRWLPRFQESLMADFAGKSLLVQELFEQHHIGQPYILRNYQRALVDLEQRGLVQVSPPAAERLNRNGIPTLAPRSCTVTFPEVLCQRRQRSSGPRRPGIHSPDAPRSAPAVSTATQNV